MTVFFLRHFIVRSTDDQDLKSIGCYSSLAHAELAVSQLRDKPGFRDPRGSFSIEEYPLDVDKHIDGMPATGVRN